MTNQVILSLQSTDDDDDDDGACCCWTSLDFGDIEQSLANKLSDDDVHGLLICIDAANRLKILKLPGCINILGTGLIPLVGSTVLQQMDLSLVKRQETPKITPDPQLNQLAIFAIMDSIIDATDSSFQHIQLPEHFRVQTNPNFDFFLQRYNEFLNRKGGKCPNCPNWFWGKNMNNDTYNLFGLPWMHDDIIDSTYALQNYTCFDCINNFCNNVCVARCDICLKVTCKDCVGFDACDTCDRQLCIGCGGDFLECSVCVPPRCKSCSLEERCRGCGTNVPRRNWGRPDYDEDEEEEEE